MGGCGSIDWCRKVRLGVHIVLFGAPKYFLCLSLPAARMGSVQRVHKTREKKRDILVKWDSLAREDCDSKNRKWRPSTQFPLFFFVLSPMGPPAERPRRSTSANKMRRTLLSRKQCDPDVAGGGLGGMMGPPTRVSHACVPKKVDCAPRRTRGRLPFFIIVKYAYFPTGYVSLNFMIIVKV